MHEKKLYETGVKPSHWYTQINFPMYAVSKGAYIIPLVSEKAKCKEDGHFLFRCFPVSEI